MMPTAKLFCCFLLMILFFEVAIAEFECSHGVAVQDSYRGHQVMSEEFQIRCKLWLQIHPSVLRVERFNLKRVTRGQLQPPKEMLVIADEVASDCVSNFLKQSVDTTGKLIMFGFSKRLYTVYCVKDVQERICTQEPLQWVTNKLTAII